MNWPKKGDKLFISNSRTFNKACLNLMPDQFGIYAFGYKKAAENLAQQCLGNRGKGDYLVYPLIFLWRHYVELRLKEILRGLNYIEQQSREFPIKHRLLPLWKLFRNRAIEIDPDFATRLDFDNMELLIREFDELDPYSMVFRYPIDKQGNNSHNLRHLDLENFHNVMLGMANFLDGATAMISDYEGVIDKMVIDERFYDDAR